MREGELRTVDWADGAVRLIDQRRLPEEEVYLECRDTEAVARAIKEMAIRGAPAIGVAAALGMALAAREYRGRERDGLLGHLEERGRLLGSTRPTAVNLFWAIERMKEKAREAEGENIAELKELLLEEALRMRDEDIAICREIGDRGAALIPKGARLLTHCNAGALATAGYGTALGVIRSAHREGRVERVYVDETRPFLQGSRLTAWELMREGIPVTLITDNMAGYLMSRGSVDAVVVGADRIARNGDVANKIGTYTVAVLANEHGVPFYVAAPLSSFDFEIASGADIPIEERSPEEVTHLRGLPIAPEGVEAIHPAFDVTPARLVDAIISERGIVRPKRGETPEGLLARVPSEGAKL
ncbi:MAG: S-methyl-5-thioribose-1-phosphate isomerase [Nitrospinota bacterium]